jgi:hypothetical protein
MSDPKIAFEMKKMRLAMDAILPVRQIKNPTKTIVRYASILSSIKEVGLIEPLIVFPAKGKSGDYLLLDGHLRYCALRELNERDVDCLIATEDESYTYNARINRLAPIQEHQMISRAVKHGVTAERIATALNLELRYVRASINLLSGIHPEAVGLLKEKTISASALAIFRRVTAVRQIEMAELMVSANNFGRAYAEALLIGTPRDQLVHSDKPKVKTLLSAEEVARMEHEMEKLERDFKGVEELYGENMLNLTLARGYVKKLLENPKVIKFLTTKHEDMLVEFEAIVGAELL